MAQSSGFFNAELVNAETQEYDRVYLAEQFAKYFSLFIANGVFPNPSNGLQVFENTIPDMSVLIHPGYAWINGYWYALDGNYTLTIEPADGALNRIDLITVRWDLEKREIYLSVIKGTPASKPQVPELSRDADYYDLCSAQVRVDAGTTKITQSMITDTRLNSEVCGIVTGVVQSIDTTTLFEQYQAAMKEFQDTRMEEFDEWQEQEKYDFDVWFQTIKDTLDGDTAGNLLNLINQEISERKAGKFTATAQREGTTVAITAPEGVETLVFVAPADWTSGDTYTINGEEVTLTDLNGEPVEDAWKQGSPVQLFVQGNKAFFKAGGGKNETLPVQVTNFTATATNTPSITVSWKNPTEYFGGILIVRKAGSDPKSISDGDKVYNGTGTTFTDTDVEFGTTYYYRPFPYNSKKQYQTIYTVANATPVAGLRLGDMPLETLVRFGSIYDEPIVWKIADINHEGYPDNSVSLVTNQAIKIMCFDAVEPNNANSERKSKGNNRYIWSNIRQWLNSIAGAGQWYTAQHSADQAPDSAHVLFGYNPYNNSEGFLNAFTENERRALLDTTITVGKSNTDGGGNETCTDKVFLMSCTEIGVQGDYTSGTKLKIFNDNSSRLAYNSDSAKANDDSGSSDVAYYWLRDAKADSPVFSQVITPSGTLSYSGAYESVRGLRPICNISADTILDPKPNADGSYNIIY